MVPYVFIPTIGRMRQEGYHDLQDTGLHSSDKRGRDTETQSGRDDRDREEDGKQACFLANGTGFLS